MVRFERLNCRLHLDPLYGRAHLELRVYGAGLANEKRDSLLLDSRKTGRGPHFHMRIVQGKQVIKVSNPTTTYRREA
jgi:hypothetical protein